MTDPEAQTEPLPRGASSTRPGALIAVALVAFAALVGANAFGLRDRLTGSSTPKARPVARGRSSDLATPSALPAQETVLKSYPWWQGVSTSEGATPPPRSPSFLISHEALQWRVIWSCQIGRLTVRSGIERQPLVDAACPATGTAYANQTGTVALSISAGGPWRVQVDQEVDVPLIEPPTAAMTAPGTATVATGTLYNIDQSGSGRVTFYRQTDGSYSLRLDGFFITPNVDLEIRLSPLAAPRSTSQYQAAPSVAIAPLDITTGSINFPVPAEVNPTQFRSLVVWCPTITSAYAAATLTLAN